MIFVGPFSPRFTADTLVVSVNVGEGGPPPGEALRFPCEFVMIAKGRRGRDFGIGRARIWAGSSSCGEREGGRGAGWGWRRTRTVEAVWRFRVSSGSLKWYSALRSPSIAQCKYTTSKVSPEHHVASVTSTDQYHATSCIPAAAP